MKPNFISEEQFAEMVDGMKQRMIVRGAGSARTVRGSDVRSHTRVGNNAAIKKPHPANSPAGAEKQNRDGRAGSNPAPSPSKNAKYAPYKNKLEHSYAQFLTMEKQAGMIKDWGYETQSHKLAVLNAPSLRLMEACGRWNQCGALSRGSKGKPPACR